MSEKEIIEGNKLIAEFMGIKIIQSRYGCNHPLVTCPYPDYSNLKYHSSWDWLMPVVEKSRVRRAPGPASPGVPGCPCLHRRRSRRGR